MDKTTTVTRVVKLRIDTDALRPAQAELLERHAGTARAAYNWGLAKRNEHEDAKSAALRELAVQEASGDVDAAAALFRDPGWRTAARKALPEDLRQNLTAYTLSTLFTAETRDPDSPLHWWQAEKHGVNRHAVNNALQGLEDAFDRYFKKTGASSRRSNGKPRKDGRPDGWPRFKRRGVSTESFSIFGITPKGRPWKVIDEGHRIVIPNLGSLRTCENTRQLRALIARGGIAKSATFSRSGGYWYVAINVSIDPADLPPVVTTRGQKAAGAVGVDVGINRLATLSTGEIIDNPAHGETRAQRVARLRQAEARRRPARGVEASAGYRQARAARARAEHKAALRRAATLHDLSKRLTTQFQEVLVEDLAVAAMVLAPEPVPDPEHEGAHLPNGAARSAELARRLLDVAPYELRRQLGYKAKLYGSTLTPVARFEATTRTCSACGAIKEPDNKEPRTTFACTECGHTMDWGLNSALVIKTLGQAQQAA